MKNNTIGSFVLWILCIVLLYFTVLLCGFNRWNYVMCKRIPIPGLGFANPSAHLEDRKRSRWMLLCIIICDHKPWHLTGVQCQMYFYVAHNCQLFPVMESWGYFFPSDSFLSQTKVFNFTSKEKNKLWEKLQTQGQRWICVKNMWQRQRNTQVARLSTAIILQVQIN